MLTVFHTADWHLGQSFCGFDRGYEHDCFLTWLLRTLELHQPNALIVSGDIFDTVNPSALAQKRFYEFLSKVAKSMPKMLVVMTAGNHDAAARLEAPAPLLNSMNIHVVGTVQWSDAHTIDYEKFLIPLTDAPSNTSAIVMAVPFLRPSDVPYVPEASDAYLEGVRELYRNVTEAAMKKSQEYTPDAYLIAMGHCHVSGGDESKDSERRLIIGGSESITLDTFDSAIAYVALGHLHKAQQFDQGRIRYSGSPIPLSFAESEYRHRILKLTFHNQAQLLVEELDIPRSVPLIRVPKKGAATIDSVLKLLEVIELDTNLPENLPENLTADQHPFLEVRVLEEGPDPARRKRIEQVLEGKPIRLASIKIESPNRDSDEDSLEPSIDSQLLDWIQPEEIFLAAYHQKYDKAPDPEVLNAFREAMQRVALEEASP